MRIYRLSGFDGRTDPVVGIHQGEESAEGHRMTDAVATAILLIGILMIVYAVKGLI